MIKVEIQLFGLGLVFVFGKLDEVEESQDCKEGAEAVGFRIHQKEEEE